MADNSDLLILDRDRADEPGSEYFPESGIIRIMRMHMIATPSSQIFYDDRGSNRLLRVTWHPEHQMAVFSVWLGDECVSTYRMPARDVPTFVHGLTNGLLELNSAPASPVAHDDTVSAEPLGEQPEQPRRETPDEQPKQPHRETTFRDATQDTVVRGLSTVIDGCSRLRDRLRRD